MNKVTDDEALKSPVQNVDRRRKVSVRTKLLFAIGALQEGTITAGGICTIIYYNQVLGVSPGMVGLAFLIASISDAISDPLVGFLSDRFNSRWGRRHPFMILSALPLALSFYFLYQPMDDLGEVGYFVWLTTFLILMRLSQTFYLIPHDALGAELTDDSEERTSIFGYNSVATMLLAMIMSSLVYYFVFPTTPGYDNGLLNEPRYFILAAAGAITIAFSVLLCTLGTLDQIPYLHKIDVSKKFLISGYFRELGGLLRNKSYLSACLSLLIVYSGLGVIGVLSSYAYLYVYGLSTEQMFWIGAAKMPGVFVALPILAFLSSRMEKKTIVMASLIFVALACSLPHNLRLLDLLPTNDSAYILYWVAVPLLLAFLVFPLQAIVIDSQLGDIADEHELNFGSRSEGVVFSIRSLGIKATQGIGGLIAGFSLEVIEFPKLAEFGNLPDVAINGLLLMNGPLYLLIYLVAVYVMSHYQLDRKRHGEILIALEKRSELKESEELDCVR